MAAPGILHRFALKTERLIDRWRPARGQTILRIEPFIGYSKGKNVVVRGRVLANNPDTLPKRIAAMLGTPGAMLSNFLTDEVSGATVSVGSKRVHSDEEGYFNLEVGLDNPSSNKMLARLEDTDREFELPVAITSPKASIGVISDIDDTVMRTGAWQLARNLWTTFTSPAEDREVFSDTVKLIRRRVGEHGATFYVSSSPWNLHQYLLKVFERNDVPFGPLFLRDLGIDETKFIKSSHGTHKLDAIRTILEANPQLTFTLIGDTGQKDGQVYLAAIEDFPGRIDEVCLRGAGTLDDADRNVAEKIRQSGVRFFSAETFDRLLSDQKATESIPKPEPASI